MNTEDMQMSGVNVILDYKNLSVSQLDDVKTTYIQVTEELNSQFLKLSKEQLSWKNLIQPSIDFNNRFVSSPFLNMKSFHTDLDVRKHASKVKTDIDQFDIENDMRKDLFELYKYYFENQYQEEKKVLNEEQISYFENKIKDYIRIGLNLPTREFERVKIIKKQLSELTSNFELNLVNYNKELVFGLEEVPGLPESFITKHLYGDGKSIKINLKLPDTTPVAEYCKNREVRKKLYFELHRRVYDTNIEIAEEVFKLRKELASLFGFENFSDYSLQDKMANKTSTVNEFLENLQTKIFPLYERDISFVTELAKKDGVDKIDYWDTAYYKRIFKELNTSLDHEEVKLNFPVERTIKNIFMIFEKLLNYSFVKTNKYDSTLWHEEVELYEVFEEGIKKGYFYLDLFPREGKHTGAAVFPMISKSEVNLPVGLLTCNFNRDFMKSTELKTFLHEFGHTMHLLTSKSKIKNTSSFYCEWDFVETPSQLFEEWGKVPEILKIISPDISNDTISRLISEQKLMQGLAYNIQLYYGILDMHIHSKSYNGKSFETIKHLTRTLFDMTSQEDTNQIASFGHIMSGYEAGYYSYLWSLVYAKDVFTLFKGREMDPEMGRKYKEQILCQGSIRPSMDSMIEFLGRKPNIDAFIESIV